MNMTTLPLEAKEEAKESVMKFPCNVPVTAIGARVDRCGGHRWGAADGVDHLGVMGGLAADQLKQSPGVGGTGVTGKW